MLLVPSQYLVVRFGIKDDWDDEKEKLTIMMMMRRMK